MHDFSLECSCEACTAHSQQQADDDAYRAFVEDEELGQVGMAEEYEEEEV